MFTAKVRLDFGDMGKRECVCAGFVTNSFGELNVRITSVQWQIAPTKTIEIHYLLGRSGLMDVEDALRERYQTIQDKYSGFPDDYPRDEVGA